MARLAQKSSFFISDCCFELLKKLKVPLPQQDSDTFVGPGVPTIGIHETNCTFGKAKYSCNFSLCTPDTRVASKDVLSPRSQAWC